MNIIRITVQTPLQFLSRVHACVGFRVVENFRCFAIKAVLKGKSQVAVISSKANSCWCEFQNQIHSPASHGKWPTNLMIL